MLLNGVTQLFAQFLILCECTFRIKWQPYNTAVNSQDMIVVHDCYQNSFSFLIGNSIE